MKPATGSRRIYYGWVIVGVVFLSSLASGAQINPTIGVFLRPITDEFEWTRSTVSLAGAIGTVIGGALALVAGPAIDKFGARWILFVSFLMSGIAIFAWGHIDQLWQFALALIVSRVALQGVINLTNQTVVAKWFVKKRGRAMAMANLGQRIGGGAIPAATQTAIPIVGWRTAAMGVGLLVMALTLIPISIFMRRQPQDMGLLPDGVRPEESEDQEGQGKSGGRVQAQEVNYTLREALRTRPFWIILGTYCLTNFVNTGVNFNLAPHLLDRGLTEVQAAVVLLTWAMVSVPASLSAGYLADRTSVRILMAVFSTGLGVGIYLFLIINSFAVGMVFAVLHGAAFAGSFLMLQLLLANTFGSKSLGTLRGFIVPWQMVANALGPLAATLVYDTTGSYGPILRTYIGLQVVLVLVLVFVLRGLKPRDSE